MSKISVIVPVYKVEKYLDRCIESILSQTFTDFELILVDDGSPDNCPDMCDKWAKKDNRIRVVHKENGGLSSARNAGLDIMTGEYVTFIDSDDYVSEVYLEKLFAALTDSSAMVSVCAPKWEINNAASKSVNCAPHILSGTEACMEIYRPRKNSVSMVASWAKLYGKSCFNDIRFPVGRIHEDQFTTYKILYGCKTVAKINNKLYNYTVSNTDSITHSGFTLKRYDDLVALDEAIQFYQKNNDQELYIAARERKKRIQADYSLMARKAKIYSKVPKQYRISWLDAWRTMESAMNNDFFEYYMSLYHPILIKVRAYLKKASSFFTKSEHDNSGEQQ